MATRQILPKWFRLRDWFMRAALALCASAALAQPDVLSSAPANPNHDTAPIGPSRPVEPEPVAATGVRGGLCVVLPATDGAALAELSCEGRFVVQGLSGAEGLDKTRAGIPARLGGLVSVVAWKPSARLDYADHLVDLLVVDRDAIKGGGPPDAELLRVSDIMST